jgi:hypothetical protein
MKKLFGLTASAVLVAALSVPAAAGSASPAVFPPDSSPLEMTYPEWVGAYQVWLNEIPTPENPFVDPASPRNCEVQTSGAVFFGPFGANCSIPEGAPLVLSGVFYECSTAEGLGDTYRQLRRCARRNFARDTDPEILHQRILIDGVRLVHLRRWIFLSPGEVIDFPKDNIWDAVPGPSKSVTKSFLWILEPPSVGTHRIRWRINDEVIGKFTITWKLTVDPYGS